MKVLIINIGPYGDVLRTTILLNEYKSDEVYWITSRKNKDILKTEKIKKLYFIEDVDYDIFNIIFDLVISLNEEWCDIVDRLRGKKIIGVYKDGFGNPIYTHESSKWFDMSLISKFGKVGANRLKKENLLSYNQILIEMVGGKWEEQKYVLDIEKIEGGTKIGLIKDVEGVWKSKRWNYFDLLYKVLKDDGYDVNFLEMRDNISDHIQDINGCNLIVCLDTFGMHVGIALDKKVIALFNSTSPQEIYNYGKLTKIVSSLYKMYFYTKEYDQKLSDSIRTQEVYDIIKTLYKF